MLDWGRGDPSTRGGLESPWEWGARLMKAAWLTVPILAVLIGCSLERLGPSDPRFVVSVLSPAGETFTIEHRNEFGAGGGPAGAQEGTGSFQDVIVLGGDYDPSSQEISGSFTGEYLVIGFGTRNGGWGADSGSIEIVEGPDPQSSVCSVQYGASEPGGSNYRLRFRFTGVSAIVCRTP